MFNQTVFWDALENSESKLFNSKMTLQNMEYNLIYLECPLGKIHTQKSDQYVKMFYSCPAMGENYMVERQDAAV